MRWFFPSWNGDVRVASHPDNPKHTLLTVIEPTAHELELLTLTNNVFRAKGWVKGGSKLWKKTGDQERQETVVEASLLEVGLILVGRLKPGIATLTAVTTEEGHVEAMGSGEAGFPKWISLQIQGDAGAIPSEINFRDVDGYAERQTEVREEKEHAAQEKADAEKAEADAKTAKKKAEDEKRELAKLEDEKKAAAKTDKAATTVKRPTPCCPQSIPGVIAPAQEVLLSFCTAEQRHQWLTERRLVAEGGITGHRYLLAHRHTPSAQKMGKICYDLDDEDVLHFHDWTVPPEEEVLAAKLILEHRETWLRNEATALGCRFRHRFKNPFGDGSDGIADSVFTEKVGEKLLAEMYRSGVRFDD